MDMGSDTEAILTAGSKWDIYVAKYTPNGDYLWSFNLGGDKSVAYSSSDIVADKGGNIFICGGSRGWLDFDPSDGKDSVWTGGNMIYLVKYGPDGKYLWANGLGFEDRTRTCHVYTLVVDTADGSVYMSGYTNGQMNFDPSGASVMLGSGPNADMFLAKYSADGDYLWARMFSNSREYRVCRPEALAIDDEGNIILGGNFAGWYYMDPSDELQVMTQYQTEGYMDNDAFLANYDRDGNYRWHLNVGSGYSNYIRSLKFHDGQIFAAGSFMDTVDFDPSEASFILESFEMEMSGYLAVYNPDGSFQKAMGIKGFEGEYSDSQSEFHDMDFDGQGKCYIIGQFAGAIDCDPSEESAEITSTGGLSDYDMVLAQYDLDLNYQWAIHAGGNSQEVGRHTVVTDSGEVLAHGYFDGDCDFDPSDGEKWLFNNGGHDLFMAWYFAFEPVGIETECSTPPKWDAHIS